MSEHYDFHYQPTGSGAISGQQVLEQTEDAINELGDYVNDNVGGAMDVAQQALETAQNAEQDAQTALDTANSFSGAIQSAQQDASTALSTAQTAQTTASNANNTAIQASQDASSAVTTANNASGQVSTLSGTVTALGQRVTTAEGNIGQNTSDITALTTRVGTAEGNITTLQNDVSIAQGNASSAMATAGTVKQQSYVLRYSSASVTDNSTIAYSTLDNTDNIKTGDKVIDVDGKIFSVVSVDTTNQTVTVGSALIDLALDANVVHTSGNETVGGEKTFNDKMTLLNAVRGIDITSQTKNCNDLTSSASGDIKLYRCTSIIGASNISNIPLQTAFILIVLQTKYTGANDARAIQMFYDVGSSSQPILYTRALYNGTWSAWVNETDKFVTTDTSQTIPGKKTFVTSTYLYNSDDMGTAPSLYFKSSKAIKGDTTGSNTDQHRITNVDKNNSQLSYIQFRKLSNGSSDITFYCSTTDTNNQDISSSMTFFKAVNGKGTFRSVADNDINLGNSIYKWKDVNTYLINGLTPSSLSLPSTRDNAIDISSYFTNFNTGDTNQYAPTVNGWIYLETTGCNALHCFCTSTNNLVHYGNTVARDNDGIAYVTFPVLANTLFKCTWYSNTTITLSRAWFIPCQGNV